MVDISRTVFKNLINGLLSDDPAYQKFYIKNYNGNTVQFENCLIEDVVLSEAISYQYSIVFKDCEFRGNFQITGGNFKKIDLHKTILKENHLFSISDGTYEGLTFHAGTIFNGNLGIRGGQFQNINFSSGSFNGGVSISNGIFQEIIVGTCDMSNMFFRSGKFQEIRVTGLSCSELHLNDVFDKVFIYGLGKIKTLYINSGSINQLYIKAPNLDQINASSASGDNRTQLKRLIFDQMGVFDGLFVNVDIEAIEFRPSYFKANTSLRFQNVTTSNVTFKGFVNYGQMTFSTLILKKELKVIDSDLGKTSFINSSIKNINLVLENSRITDSFFSDTSFPSKVATNDHQQRMAYAQLKKINESKGDYLEANRFYALEMNAYYDTIQWTKKTVWEKLNLLLNKHSNNHGQEWSLGLKATFIVGGVFYLAYLAAFGGWEYKVCSLKHWMESLKYLSYFFEFINPIHKTDAVAESMELVPNHGTRFIETISRIFIAYTIYQMVQAFRKHAKK